MFLFQSWSTSCFGYIVFFSWIVLSVVHQQLDIQTCLKTKYTFHIQTGNWISFFRISFITTTLYSYAIDVPLKSSQVQQNESSYSKSISTGRSTEPSQHKSILPLPKVEFLVSWTTDTGSIGYPLFRFGMGCEGGLRLRTGVVILSRSRSLNVLASYSKTQGVTQVQAARRLTALLLHIWIGWFIMVILQGWFSGVPGRWVDGG